MKQTGLLFKFDPKDWVTGASPLPYEVLVKTGDWRDYLPAEEAQSVIKFDTMSCTTFSALSAIETQINYLIRNKKISGNQLKLLEELGCVDGFYKVNFSDRFTAIKSGTTKQGNFHQNVWDSIKRDGLLPERDLPFGGTNWDEYHNKTVITKEMEDKAKKILSVFNFAYEWAVMQPDADLSVHLKHAPLHGAIPFPAYHAVVIPSGNYVFDTYKPFLYERKTPLHYAVKGVVTVKPEVKPASPYKYFSAKEVAQWKLKDEMFKKLDEIRGECGFALRISSGLRTQEENDKLKDSVSDSAHLTGLACDIFVQDSSQRMKLVTVALKNGIRRIGIGKTFVHLDVDTSKPQDVMWHYY